MTRTSRAVSLSRPCPQAMLQTGDGARRDARSAFEILGRDAGERRAPDLVARRFPGLPRHAQHRALPRSGIADHDAEIAPVRDMRQRLGLLSRENKTARFRARQRGFALPVTDLMAFLLGHQLGGAVQALFGLDHLACGEAILAASVLAQFDQIGRFAHRAHHGVELLDAIAVPVREPRHVAAREGGLLMGDGVERDGRIGDDALAVAARDLAVQFGAVGLEPLALDARGGRADLALRLQRDALRFEAAMVDPRVDVEFGQPLIGELRPAFAPALDHLGAVPVPHLFAEAVFVDRAHGQHDMRVGLGRSRPRLCPNAH